MVTETELRKKIDIDPETHKENVAVFDPHPKKNEASIEVPLTPEQYECMRKWLDANDFIEIVTGPGKTKATLVNSRLLWQKNHPGSKGVLGGEFLSFRVQLLSPFVDFIEKYLDFFNEPGSLEDFIMGSVYEKVWALHSDLTQFVKTPGHRLELQGWLEKFPERIHGHKEDEEET